MKDFLPNECVDCVIRKKLNDYPKGADEASVSEYKKRVLELVLYSDPEGAAPLISREVLLLQKRLFGVKTDFKNIKRRFNEAMLKTEEYLRKKINKSDDPFLSALKYAAAANYIDYSTVKDLNEKTLLKLLKKAPKEKLDKPETENLKKEILFASKIVYITDNCGEIVADKLFIEVIKNLNPAAKITAIVRGKEVVNDATKEDAEATGLNAVCTVFSNGSDVAGTYLKEIDKTAYAAVKEADVIIAKGQGNYETLRGSDLNIYYLFLCKCEMFSAKFASPLFAPIITNEKRQ